ncbi:MAG TPA: permease [Jatrophihabitans sp.]|nr:permease [Jatrophihabitans sp.]
MELVHALLHALRSAAAMGWEILWPLILGFFLSGAIQAVVSHRQMSRLLPDDSARTVTKASLLGAASSSCSYAAVALARSIFRKGGNFTAAMAFEIASTNLVIELGIILILFLGWEFTAAEFVGGPIMIALLAILLRRILNQRRIEQARRQADQGLVGRMEGHAAMDDMSVAGDAPLWRKLWSPDGHTATSHFFVMDWASVWTDIVLGLLIAGALEAWVPMDFWQTLFLTDHPTLAWIIGPLIGPVIAILGFVCSVGNVPLAAVLWNGGLSFGGVVSFIFADLIVLPVLRIKQKYYGTRMMLILFGSFFLTMAAAGYTVEGLFALLRLTPTDRNATVLSAGFEWNYTAVLNIVFLVLAALLVVRFLRTGGPAMLRRMSRPGEEHAHAH